MKRFIVSLLVRLLSRLKQCFYYIWNLLLSRLQLTFATRCVLRANGGGDRDLEFLRTSWKSHLPDLPDPIKSIARVDKAKRLILFCAVGALFMAFFVGWYDWVVATISAVAVLVSVIAFWPGNILSLVSRAEFESCYGFLEFFMTGKAISEDAEEAFEDSIQE